MTAENVLHRARPAGAERAASMRPRPMTAENTRRFGRRPRRPSSFNEAAADDRGKPTKAAAAGVATQTASMRPRPMTAENAGVDSDRVLRSLLQ